MELRQLEYFQMVAQFQNFTKAAEQLHVSQPSITVAIHKLEEELEVPLFIRKQKRVTLTVQGKLFQQRVNEIMSSLQNAINEMSDYRENKRETLNVGMTPILMSFFCQKIFIDFIKKKPHVDLRIHEFGSDEIVNALNSGLLDLGQILLDQCHPMLEYITLGRGEIKLCLPPNHPLCKLPAVPFSMLKGERFILIKEGASTYRRVLKECEKAGFKPNIIFFASQVEDIFKLVSIGAGISFEDSRVAASHPEVVTRPLVEPMLVEFCMAWRKGRYLSKNALDFIELICNE